MDASALPNSIAVLRSSIKYLESCSNSLESWLHLFVALVVIGVVLEFVFVFWEYREKLEEFRRGTIRSPQKPSGGVLFFEILGAALVAIGVAGELGVDIKAGRIQTDLRARNGELIELLERVSSAALGAASQNEKDAAQLRKDAEGLKKTAEDERLARVKIVEKMAWRTLDDDQKKRIVGKLKSFSGTPFDLATNSDPESVNFLGILESILTSSKWSEQQYDEPQVHAPITVSTPKGNTAGLGYESGILVVLPPEKTSEWGQAANALASALLAEGIDAKAGFNPDLAKHKAIRVICGRKP